MSTPPRITPQNRPHYLALAREATRRFPGDEAVTFAAIVPTSA